jgi:hypothetical protein
MYNTYNPQSICWSLFLSLSVTQRHILSLTNTIPITTMKSCTRSAKHPHQKSLLPSWPMSLQLPHSCLQHCPYFAAPIAQSVQSPGCGTDDRQGQNILQTGSPSHSATCHMAIGGPSSPLATAPVGWRKTTSSSAKIKCV